MHFVIVPHFATWERSCPGQLHPGKAARSPEILGRQRHEEAQD